MAYEAKQAVYLPVMDFLNLEFYLMDTRPGVKPDAFVTELVNRWLAVEMERLSLRERGHAMRGFQWKNVFLPEGTSLRTSYCDLIEFAKVVGDQVVTEDGAKLTPSQFANRRAKGRTHGVSFGYAFLETITGFGQAHAECEVTISSPDSLKSKSSHLTRSNPERCKVQFGLYVSLRGRFQSKNFDGPSYLAPFSPKYRDLARIRPDSEKMSRTMCTGAPQPI